MNLAMRKLAMLEETMNKREEEARVLGYSTVPVDRAFKERITKLMDKVRYI